MQALRDRIYGYYTTLASKLSSSLSPETILTGRVLQDTTITHLLYKALMKIAVWSWQRIDKYSKEEAAVSKTWVGKFQHVNNFMLRQRSSNHSYSSSLMITSRHSLV